VVINVINIVTLLFGPFINIINPNRGWYLDCHHYRWEYDGEISILF